jgi:hypothetical protein
MNIFITAIVCILITDTYANFNVISRSSEATMLTSKHEFKITTESMID